MGLDVEQYPPSIITLFDSGYERTRCDKPERSADQANLYEHALGLLERFTKEVAGWRSSGVERERPNLDGKQA